MTTSNGPSATEFSPSLTDAETSRWNWLNVFLIQQRVRITGIAFVLLVCEDFFFERLRPHSVIDFADAISMLGLGLVLCGALLRSWAAGTLHKNSELTMSGPYGLMRHPLYIGSFLTMLGFCTLIGDRGENFLFVLGPILVLYTFRAIQEEHLLAKKFPAQWSEFAKRVPRLLVRRLPQNAFGAWSRDQWTRNREYRFVGATLLGLLALQTWHVWG